jgi:hypothetical protein
MPVVSDLRVSLTTEQVSSAWGASRARPPVAPLLARVSGILSRMDAEQWLRPALAYRICKVVATGTGWMDLAGGTRLHARLLTHHLRRASHLAIGVSTLGSALEGEVSKLFASNDRLTAVVLDDIGTFALYELGAQFDKILRDAAAGMGLEASGVLCPGEDGFDIREQKSVAEIAGADEIGVSLTSAGMFVPRKSHSVVMGFGARMPYWDRDARCDECGARERCPHRRRVPEAVVP